MDDKTNRNEKRVNVSSLSESGSEQKRKLYCITDGFGLESTTLMIRKINIT